MATLTSPTPSRSVFNAHPPQSVYCVTVVVCSLNVQFVSKEGSLRMLSVHVGAGGAIDDVEDVVGLGVGDGCGGEDEL